MITHDLSRNRLQLFQQGRNLLLQSPLHFIQDFGSCRPLTWKYCENLVEYYLVKYIEKHFGKIN